MDFVLDASIALSWCFPDESNAYADLVLDAIGPMTAVVPSIWAYEVANAMLVAQRHGRITEDHRIQVANMLNTLPIQTHDITLSHTLKDISSQAKAFDLTVYDAAYLDLAVRIGKPLATADRRLREAANRVGIAEFDRKTGNKQLL